MSSQSVTLPCIRELFPEYVGAPIHRDGQRPDEQEAQPQTPTSGSQTVDPARRFPCTICDKRFSRPSALETHMNSHTGEKPHRCPYHGCNKGFSARSNMQRHLRTHGSVESLTAQGLLAPAPYQGCETSTTWRRT